MQKTQPDDSKANRAGMTIAARHLLTPRPSPSHPATLIRLSRGPLPPFSSGADTGMTATMPRVERRTALEWAGLAWSAREGKLLAAVIGGMRGEISENSIAILARSYQRCSEDARIRMNEYTPRIDAERWTEIGPFVRDTVSVAAPVSSYTAHRLLIATTHYVTWCRVSGLPLNAKALFQRATIEHYVRGNLNHLGEGTLRNYRSMLLRISEALFPETTPKAMRPLNARGGVAPYPVTELNILRNWANGQNSEGKRQKARAMLSLCAGAGLRAMEVAELRGHDVTVDGNGILVTIRSIDSTRFVPMLAEWEPMMRRAIEGVGEADPVFGMPGRTTYKNLLSGFVENTVGTVRPRSDRLRATWIVTHLRARTDMRALMEAAAVSKFENLARYLRFVPELDTVEYRQHLRVAVAK